MQNLSQILFLIAGILIGALASTQMTPRVSPGAVPNWQLGVSQTKDSSIAAWRLNSHSGRMESCTVAAGKATCILMPNLP